MSDSTDPVKTIFLQAIEHHSPHEWPAFLDEACAGDAALRAGIENLLRAQLEMGSFHEQARAFAPTIDPSHVEPIGTTLGPYKLLQQIGEGGMGIVFMAEQTEPVRRKVAVKVIKPGMDSRQVIARFEAERQALALMDHVNIARVFDAGATENGRPYFVMELVHGVSITNYCDDNRLTPRQRLELFVPVCQAIQHAHQKGVIHRDIKPSNIMVTLYDGKPVAKVIDFGVAKATEQKLTERTLFTQYGTMVGTLEYMSPEQAEMSALGVDTRSDIYSLGVLLYELLTGSTPLSRKRVREAAYAEILRMIKEEEPQKPSTRLSDSGEALASISANRHTEPAKLAKLVRGELDWIVMKTLEKDRNRRYETANGFALDIQRYLADEPVLACPPSAVYRFRKFVRRNKAALATVGILFMALLVTVAGLAVSNVLVRGERNEKIAALDQKEKALGEKQAAFGAKEAALKVAKANYAEARRQEALAKTNAKNARKQEKIAHRRFYTAQMNLAMEAWEDGHPARTLQLLESQRPRFDEDDLRGFDWYYLWRLCQGNYRYSVPTLSVDNATGIAISPDGATLAAGYGDAVRLWNVSTGRQIGELTGHAQMISGLAFSPDGKTLAAADESETVKLWDPATTLLRVVIQSGQRVNSVQFTGDGRRLVLGGKRVKLWDVLANEEVAALGASGEDFYFVAVAPDGAVVAASGNDVVRIWIQEGGEWREAPPVAKVGYFPRIAISSNGKLLAIGGGTHSNGAPMLYELPSGQERITLQGHTGSLFAIEFTADGKRLASGGVDRTVRIWDIATGQQQACIAQPGPVHGLALTPDGETVAAKCAEAIRVWNVAPPPPASVLRHLTHVNAVAFSPDGKIVASRVKNQTKLWDVAEERILTTLRTHTSTWLQGLAFSPNGESLAIPTANAVKLWSVSGEQLADLACEALVHRVAYSPDGKSLAAATQSGVVEVWELSSQQRRYSTQPGNIGVAVAYSPDGKTIAAGYQFGVVKLFDAASGRELSTLQRFELAIDWAYCLAFSPDGRKLATGNQQGLVRIWDVATNRLESSLIGHTNAVRSLAFVDGGRILVTGSEDRTARLWEVETGQETIALKGHAGAVTGVAFSERGNVLATSSEDGSVRLWRAAVDDHARAPQSELEPESGQSPVADNESGDRLWQASRTREAEAAYRRALDRLEKLLAAVREARRMSDGRAEAPVGALALKRGASSRSDPELSHEIAYHQETIRSLLSIGLLLRIERGDPAAAELMHRRAMEIYRTLAPQEQRAVSIIFSERQRKLSGSGAVQQADRTWSQMIEVMPRDDAGWMSRAAHHLAACSGDPRLRDTARAVELARHAVALPAKDKSERAQAWANLGVALECDGRRSEAAEPYRQATELWRELTDADADNEWYRQGRAWFSLARANVLHAAGRSEEALEPCRVSLELGEQLAADFPSQPHHAERVGQARNVLVAILSSLRRDDEAAEATREQEKWMAAHAALRETQARKSIPFEPPEDRGWRLLDEEKFAAAETAFREAVRLRPDHAPVYRGLGKALLGQEKRPEAIARFREAIRLDPLDFWGHEHLGWALLEEQQPAEAEAAFREAIRIQPALTSGHAGLGRSLFEQKKFFEALGPQREGARLDPSHFHVRESLGRTLIALKLFDEAETAFREAVRLKPGFASGHFGLGNALVEHERFAEAETELREALRLEPTNLWVPARLAEALIGQGKISEAEADHLLPASNLAAACMQRANVLRRQKKFPQAEAALRNVIRLEPAYPSAHGLLGWVLLDQQKFPEAETEFREAIRLDANNYSAHDALGWVLIKQQRPVEAETEFRACVRLQPDRAAGHWGLGKALFDQEKFADAELSLREAIRLEPAHPWAQSLLTRALAKQGKPSEAGELLTGDSKHVDPKSEKRNK